MKLQKLLPITLLAAGAMVACTPKAPVDKTVYKVEIANKAELTASWNVGDAARNLTVNVFDDNVQGNSLEQYTTGELKITTDKDNIVSLTGFKITPVSAGSVKITVSYHNVTDYVDLTIAAKPTNKDKYGTVHEGTEEDPFDNEDAVKVGQWCKTNGNTTEELVVRGEIASFYHAPGSRTDGAVSWYLKPAAGKTEKFEVYKCYKSDGSFLTDDDVWAGAVVTAKGIFTYYASGNQAETTAAVYIKTEGTKPADPVTIESTVTNAITEGLKLDDGGSTWDYYAVTGYVVVKDNDSQYWISDDKTLTASAKETCIELYGINDTAMQAKLTKGAKVKVTMRLKNYHSTIENSGNPTALEVLEAGEAWTVSYAGEGTVSEILPVAKALGENAYSEGVYKVSGVIVKITGAWSAQYGNINFTIGDTVDATETLTVFRLVCTEAEAAKFVAGKAVVVAGTLQNYVKNGNSTYEITSPKLISIAA